MALKLKKKKPKPQHTEVDDYLEIAEKVRTGEYFREARGMYDLGVHDPMAERYMYVFITAISIVIFLIAQNGMNSLYPLNTDIPLIIAADDDAETTTHIKPLLSGKEDAGLALLGFFVKNYITAREEYNITTFDRNVGSVKTQSTQEVLDAYQKLIDPRNPESPIAQYQRHSKRKINILSMRGSANDMEVIFDADVESRTEIKRTRWLINIAFQYSGLELDKKTGNIKPVDFVVTRYQAKRLQEVK